jgi:integrase
MRGGPQAVVDELAEYKPVRAKADDLVVTAPKGGPLRLNGFRYRFWSKAVKAAGLAGFRIHDLRHTAVSPWIAAGANPKIVAARAGRTSVSFTLDRYGHLFPEADEQLRRQLDRLIRKTAPRRPRRWKPGGGDSPA